MTDKGHSKDIRNIKDRETSADLDNFVLEKGIFSNIFEKDIRRVYIYKKAERLAKAIHLVGPAFVNSPALRNRVDLVAVGLVDAATLPPSVARDALSRELLALSSLLSMARVGGLLSVMNVELIAREAHTLLQEVATYEEPRLFLDDTPTLAELFKSVATSTKPPTVGKEDVRARSEPQGERAAIKDTKGQAPAAPAVSSRKESILAVLRSKGPSYIKDISTVIRNVSEKTIQRELAALVEEGRVTRIGERRWTMYTAQK